MAPTDCKAAGLAPKQHNWPFQLRFNPNRIGLPLLLAAWMGSAPEVSAAAPPVATPVLPPAQASAAGSSAESTSSSGSRLNTGLVSIESDLQRVDQSTGVVTASGNVRIVYPDQRVVATARQAQYFSREGRVVLSGEVDIVQASGSLLRAEQVIYLVGSERLLALPPAGQQVFSRLRLPPPSQPNAAQSQQLRPLPVQP
ncbi:MAG: hypothetical protein RLZZ611_1085 [Cyanobacteriota bacterium]|jgi:lipopolysaccharide export system protein LptA